MRSRRFKVWFLVASMAVLAGCPDDGGVLEICGNPDLSCDDSNACTMDSCDPQLGCVNDPISCNDGDACTVDSCDSVSGCLSFPLSCDDNNACTEDGCDAVAGCFNTDISDQCDDGSVCTEDSCNTLTGCVNTPLSCDDGNECTAETCDPTLGCDSTPVLDGTSCNRGLGQCVGGVCEALDCESDADCNDSDACTMDVCNLETNECVNTDISDQCDDNDACTADSCDPDTGCSNIDDSARCDDGEECTAESCDPITGCSSELVPNGTICDGGAGVCTNGSCLSSSIIEYDQNFESLDQMDLDALGDDGWSVFGNVFDGGTGNFLYGYGPFVAPNDGAAFSAIVLGQGGPEQGGQQVSVYSDYNNTDHAVGHTIESNFFRERSITAADVGRRITFSFDAKRGNINDPGNELCPCTSTAFAFIKTLDPADGFSLTNFVQEDTTSLPDEWGRYEISLRIDAALVGQLLQVGFACTATLYEPSANFYDNVQIESAAIQP